MSRIKTSVAITTGKLSSPSMGASVAYDECVICGGGVPSCEHTRGPQQGGARFISASLVPAPDCPECGHPMVPADHTDWKCSVLTCSAQGVPVYMGVTPILPV